MSGVYGSIITAFPEQIVTVEYFDMEPLHGSGWGPRMDKRPVKGVLQCTKGRQVKDSNGNLVTSRGMEFWSEEDLESGRFIDDGIMVYRISGDNEWFREVGYTVYSLEKVVASDGTEIVEPAFKTGEGSFA